MPATSAIIGYGSTASGVSLGEIVSISVPSITADAPEATNLASPDNYKEYIPGLADGGEVSFVCNYTESGYAAAATAMKTAVSMTLTLAAGQTVAYSGIGTGLEMEVSNGVQQFTFTQKVTGKPTIT